MFNNKQPRALITGAYLSKSQLTNIPQEPSNIKTTFLEAGFNNTTKAWIGKNFGKKVIPEIMTIANIWYFIAEKSMNTLRPVKEK